MTIKALASDETADEREVRVWFSARSSDPRFIKQVSELATDLLKVKKALASQAKVRVDKGVVVMWNRDVKTVIDESRWTYFVDRGYVSKTTPPQLTPSGNRMLKLYAHMIQQARAEQASGA